MLGCVVVAKKNQTQIQISFAPESYSLVGRKDIWMTSCTTRENMIRVCSPKVVGTLIIQGSRREWLSISKWQDILLLPCKKIV